MNETSIILLYSSNSKACNLFMEQFSRSIVNIHTVCIDSSYVRNRIVESNIIVKHVPCIMVVNSIGTVETYNGRHAFNFMSSLETTSNRNEDISNSEMFVPANDLMSMKTPIVISHSSKNNVNNKATTTDMRNAYSLDVSDESQIKVIKGVKSATSMPDLMTTAQAMQKARELDMENTRPVSND